ncbi:PREDICTED: angiogenic factor with G patch and FHA domains 1-like isoform X2 [Dinoponera quadriceps]|uniref:Angiogenic factor with G patch and FHA domains 1-like isoform X2 n=1 Tax=Dinoponera quadriceps TaxID=609295 RepID=A0A6P3Y6Z8_DINQU|nr:PREDICTED: angiogenic factor with G patch and FHA domains 1-like isoform X2 [Dinoponera quadriceps]
MDECKILIEDEKEEIISDLEEDFTIGYFILLEDLLSGYPHVSQFVHKLYDHIKKQRKEINNLRNKLAEQKHQSLPHEKTYVDGETQTNPSNLHESLSQNKSSSQDSDINSNDKPPTTTIDQIKKIAESTLSQTGFGYKETHGIYYVYNSGYYFDTRYGLYYDGNTGICYYYDKVNNTYQLHSQVEVRTNEATNVSLPSMQKLEDAGKVNEASNEIDGLINSFSDITLERCRPQIPDLVKIEPCMRMIVIETNMEELKIGSLFLVTCTGGTVGRKGDHLLLIPDESISKHHARFIYDETDKQYRIIDYGSTNGTFLNGKKLSEFNPYVITHGSTIKIGETKLVCHIHYGSESCDYCDPAIMEIKLNLKKSSIDKPIPKHNKGYEMLMKMNWSEGCPLGKNKDGITEPIRFVKKKFFHN